MLVWDPDEPGTGPVELGRHEGGVEAVAVLPDGRVVTGGDSAGGCWCGTRRSRAPARSSSAATRAGWGRWRCCRTGGWSPAARDGRVLVWDPARRRAPARSSSAATTGGVKAVAVLPDGRVVTGGDDWVRLRNVQGSSPGTLLACSAYALATSLSPSGARLFIGHAVGGISCWEVRAATQNTLSRQRAGNAMITA